MLKALLAIGAERREQALKACAQGVGSCPACATGPLYLEHDILLSPHRSEGYGLSIREALAHGLYALATGYGGNMDFMDHPRARILPFKLVPAKPKGGQSSCWAEPDLEQGAEILRSLAREIRGGI